VKKSKNEKATPGEWKEVEVECPECHSKEFVLVYVDDPQKFYCIRCDDEFDLTDLSDEFGDPGDVDDSNYKLRSAEIKEDREIQEEMETRTEVEEEEIEKSIEHLVSDDPEVVKEMADRILDSHSPRWGRERGGYPPAYSDSYSNSSGNSYQNYTPMSYTACTHPPFHVIDGGKWGVWAGRKDDSKYRAKEFDIILNLTFTSIKEPHVIPIPELQKYEDVECSFIELQLDWPDFGTINMPREFWVDLLKYLEANNFKMLVFCQGGHGRTGTALAVMMGLALDYNSEDAMKWVRQNYCFQAIESLSQEAYIRRMLNEPPKVPNITGVVTGDHLKSAIKGTLKGETKYEEYKRNSKARAWNEED
jgi:hypothetical protein